MKFLFPLVLIASLLDPSQAQSPPASFSHAVAFGGETVTVNFTSFSCRGPHFAVFEQQANQGLNPHVPAPVRTYIGSVEGKPGAIAAGMLRADGTVLARIMFEDGAEWIDTGTGVTERTSTVTPRFPDFIVRAGGAGSTLYAIEVGIDLPHDQVVSSGGTTAMALEMAEFSMMAINVIYLRDTNLINRIERVIVRLNADADPYNEMTTTAQLLNEVANQWRNVLPQGNHDLGLVASTQAGGGLASMAVVGDGYSSNGADANGDFSVVARHEIGHNWSLGHFDGGSPEGATINSGNSLSKMSGPELEKVLSHRDDRTAFLSNLGNTAPPLPPRAADDSFIVEPGSGNLNLMVLANDNDANGDPVSLTSFDPQTRLGRPIASGGANVIGLPAPADYSARDDSFAYRISDSTGKQGIANVHLRTLLSGDVEGHWTFEHSTGRLLDSSAKGRHGSLEGDARISEGVLVLDGDGDYGGVPAPAIQTNTVTFAAMIYRDGNQPDFTGIVSSRDGSNTAGLNLGWTPDLHYHWAGTDWAHNSGLTVPSRTWTFVALVVEPDKATFYMNPGTGLQKHVRIAAHAKQALHAPFRLGQEPLGARYLKGMLDDVRIIKRALSEAEIADLAAGGLGTCNPKPAFAQEIASSYGRLSWTASPVATQQRLYFSGSYTEVRDATIGDAADQGIKTLNFHELGGLANGTYYWRIDSMEPSGLVKGQVWTFAVVPAGLIAHWPLNEMAGATAIEAVRGRNGVIHGNPALGQSGASLDTETCHCHDGAGDYTEIPYDADLNPESFTLSLWAKVNGGDGSYRSPFTSRDAGPPRGYIIYATSGNQWSFWIGNGRGWSVATAPDTITNNRWYHLAATHGDAASQLYIDGELKASGDGTIQINTVRPLRIGAGATEGPTGVAFNGCLDDVRLWNRVLSQEEITSLAAYHRWTRTHDLSGADADPAAVPGSNGLSNLYNFGVGAGPDTVGSPVPNIPSTGGQAEFFLPDPPLPGLTYVIQTATVLGEWTDIATKAPQAPWVIDGGFLEFAPPPNDRFQFLRSTPRNEARRFWQLVVRN